MKLEHAKDYIVKCLTTFTARRRNDECSVIGRRSRWPRCPQMCPNARGSRRTIGDRHDRRRTTQTNAPLRPMPHRYVEKKKRLDEITDTLFDGHQNTHSLLGTTHDRISLPFSVPSPSTSCSLSNFSFSATNHSLS